MPWYDAIVTTFASVCTGGFGVRNTSFAAYNSTCQLIAIVFMILGSLNFALFFLILTGRTKQAFASDEMKFFLGVVVVVSLLVFCDILPGYDSPLTALKDAVFQVSSVISTSGFSTVDYAQWPTFSQTLLVMLMFLGGCAGSTAGGMKCSRILLLLRCAKRSVLRLNHPRSVKVVKLDGKVVDEDVLTTVYSYSICFFLLLGAGSVILSLDGFSLTTTLSAALACLTNVGPGLGQVGPALSYAIFSAPCKYLLSLFMLVGRLEIFPILLLFLPSTWRKS
jgi:trk system potassium uptake protein TrkH